MIPTKGADMVIRHALQMLRHEDLLTTEKIRIIVSCVVEMLYKVKQISNVERVDEDQIVREIETMCNVYVPAVSTLDDTRDHREWLSSRRATIEWCFWNRYKRYLEDEVIMPPMVVQRLDEVTGQILSRLEDPTRPGSWDRRGMVVGQVQSGKTSNYTALICKAVDAGYKLIIVLAGTHNSLRSQTQLRLDESFVGFDTQQRRIFNPNNMRIGVGLLRGVGFYRAHSLTNSADNGDFNVRVARQAHVMIGGAEPVLLVVKKNASVLKYLLQWLTRLQPGNHSNLQEQIHGVPLLLIDDEADNASINTNPILDENGRPDPEMDPSTINGLIRRLLNSFEQSAYVGYTATPFANIFIADKVTHNEYGEDLFPRSFIINLQPPTNYFGPVRLFGQETDQENISSGLPLIRHVDDYQEWIPDKHKKEHRPGSLPLSVKRAMKSFILACAVRYARGQIHEHNSMLIHVTRFTAVQSYVSEQVKEDLSFIQQRLRYGDGHAPDQIIDEFKSLWDTDFEPTMQKFSEPDLTPVTWDQIKSVLYLATSKIEVRKINGTAKDTLQYVEHREEGLSVICIGGDKLSRGLTLYGLSVSYYLRASKMYDTLMQMGRWFGYRNGYTDLCRLYTSSELEDWYRDITGAGEELRQMFEDMAVQEKTPEEFGLGVKRHPALMITAAVKSRHGQRLRLSYSEHIAETVVFFDDADLNHHNLQATERLIQDLNARYTRRNPDQVGSTYIWDGVDVEAIVDFLTDYTTHDAARTVRSSILNKYINERIRDNELIEWTVALISVQKQVQVSAFRLANLPIGLTERARVNDTSDTTYRIGRLVSPPHEWIDLSDEEQALALEETKRIWRGSPETSKRKEEPDSPSGLVIRRTRPARRGLLLLYILKYKVELPSASHEPLVGFAISFPKSDRGEESGIEYMVNNVYWQQEFGGEL